MNSPSSFRRIGKPCWILILVLCALDSCQVDSRYNFENLADLDLTVTLFEKGIELPAGNTGRISIGQLSQQFGDALDEDADGCCSFNYSGVTDLSDRLTSVNVPSFDDIDGVNFSKSMEYDAIIDRSIFHVEGQRWERYFPVGGITPVVDTPEDGLDDSAKLHMECILPETSVSLAQVRQVSYNVSSAKDLGNFNLVPDKRTEITVTLSLPSRDKVRYVTSDEGLSIILPSWIVVVSPSEISPSSSFNPLDNTVTYHGDVPEKFTIPVGYFIVRPDDEGQVCGDVVFRGAVRTSETTMEYGDIVALGESGVSVVMEMPDISAKEIIMEGDLAIEMDESFEFTLIDGSDLPDEIDSVSEIILEDTWMTCTVEIEGLPEIISGAFIVDLTAELPSCLSPSTLHLYGTPGRDGRIVSDPVKIGKISNPDFSSGDACKGMAHVYGSIRAQAPDVELSGMPDRIKVRFNAEIADGEGKIGVGRIVSRCSYDIACDKSIVLDGIPEILRSSDNCIDIVNPELEIGLSGNLSIPLTATMEIVPWKGGLAGTDKVVIDGVGLPCTNDTDVFETLSYSIAGEKLSRLFRQIPDSLQICVRGCVDPSRDCIVDPGAEYRLELSWALSMPLEAGDEFSIAIADTLDFGADLAAYMKMGSIGLRCGVANTIPLELEVSLDFLDFRGNIVKVSEKEICGVVSAGHGYGSEAVLSEVDFLIDPMADADLDSIASLRVSFRLKGSGRETVLNSADYVEADVSLVLPEGITTDLRELQP